MENLRCKNCGKRSAITTTKAALKKLSGSPIGSAGIVAETASLLPFMKIAFQEAIDWLKDNKVTYVFCNSCGHYEKL